MPDDFAQLWGFFTQMWAFVGIFFDCGENVGIFVKTFTIIAVEFKTLGGHWNRENDWDQKYSCRKSYTNEIKTERVWSESLCNFSDASNTDIL